jgi:hypothetical protein
VDLSERDLLLVEAIELVGRLLGEADLPAALIDGHAVNVWQRPRFTDDLDFTVAPTWGIEEQLRRLRELVRSPE